MTMQTGENEHAMRKILDMTNMLHKLKEQGLTRFIGFSGHANAEALTAMASRGDFDTMLIAANHWRSDNPQPRQEMAIPVAKANNMGVILMKVIRPRETIAVLDPNELVRYALSIEGPDVVVVGTDSMAVLESNLNTLRNFKPMDPERIRELTFHLAPFYNHENLLWMQSGYCDGNWA